MSYSQDALTFSTIPPSYQIRIEDRVSFLYLDYCLVRQDRTGVIAIRNSHNDDNDNGADPHDDTPMQGVDSAQIQRLQLPVAGLGVLCLGPGTSISNAAITSCTRSGCTVVFSGGGGINAYSHATPLTSSARWAIAQARMFASDEYLKEAAVKLYSKQFGAQKMPTARIAVMRGVEGRMMRNLYREEAKKAKIRGFKRDTKATDPVNTGLNVANSIMYGLAATACAAIGVNPALGIIHRGDIRALLFDLADLYKARIVIPLVFRHAHDQNPIESIRKELRQEIFKRKLMEDLLETLMMVLKPHLPDRHDDRLIDDEDEVAGHIRYDKDEE